jgi:hypothetical protein
LVGGRAARDPCAAGDASSTPARLAGEDHPWEHRGGGSASGRGRGVTRADHRRHSSALPGARDRRRPSGRGRGLLPPPELPSSLARVGPADAGGERTRRPARPSSAITPTCRTC